MALAAVATALLGGCSLASQPLVAALAGAGGSTMLSHSINGTAYRTFTAPKDEVRLAVVAAFKRMGIDLESVDKLEETTHVVGSAARRAVYVDIEPLSAKSTRIRVITKNGDIFYDSATSAEIVVQTEKILAEREAKFAARRTAGR